MYLPPPWYVVMPWRLTLSLAPSWHVVLTLLMPPCSSAACCRMRGSCARWARWCDDVLAAAVVRGDVIEADVVLGAVLARVDAVGGHLGLTLLMPPCSSAACCRMRGSCARWARWCSSAACCRTCDVDRVRDELETRLARETPRSDLVALPDTACELQPLYVVEYVPNLERLAMSPDTSACEDQPLYVMEYVPNLERLAMSWHWRRSGSAQGSRWSAPCRC